MKNRVFNMLAAVSLVLCVAMVVLWVRSYWNASTLTRYSRSYDGAPLVVRECFLSSGQFILIFRVFSRGGYKKVEYSFRENAPESRVSLEWDWDWHLGGLGWVSIHATPDLEESPIRVASIPCWFVVACFSILPVDFVYRSRRQNRLVGQCLSCSYDLTGNVSGICPECGTAIPARAEIA